MPPSNSYINKKNFNFKEKFYPLRVVVCDKCWLVQTDDHTLVSDHFHDEYAYFSGYSQSWLKHSYEYSKKMIERFNLDEKSLVVEVASNDGSLLENFQKAGVPCYGIEPTASTAKAAKEKNLNIIEDFFSTNLAKNFIINYKQVDLMVANNVLAHVPDINDFVGGFKILLKNDGIATFEFPHLTNLIEKNQFDTIYHEHYSYLSLTSVLNIFKKCDLTIFDVEELNVHGGSLRVYVKHSSCKNHKVHKSVSTLLEKENDLGVSDINYYKSFEEKAQKIKADLLKFLVKAKKMNKKVIAYGAAAKGNTLLNFCNIKSDLIKLVVDLNPYKQNKLMPGSKINIQDESYILKEKPDYILILPWNLKSEIINQLQYSSAWDCKFVTAIPNLQII